LVRFLLDAFLCTRLWPTTCWRLGAALWGASEGDCEMCEDVDDWRAIGGGRRGCAWASAEEEAMLTLRRWLQWAWRGECWVRRLVEWSVWGTVWGVPASGRVGDIDALAVSTVS
jgi:hypothetical protein